MITEELMDQIFNPKSTSTVTGTSTKYDSYLDEKHQTVVLRLDATGHTMDTFKFNFTRDELRITSKLEERYTSFVSDIDVTFKLKGPYDLDGIVADLDCGILTLTLPLEEIRTEPVQVRWV